MPYNLIISPFQLSVTNRQKTIHTSIKKKICNFTYFILIIESTDKKLKSKVTSMHFFYVLKVYLVSIL